jgi:hypothetical protein
MAGTFAVARSTPLYLSTPDPSARRLLWSGSVVVRFWPFADLPVSPSFDTIDGLDATAHPSLRSRDSGLHLFGVQVGHHLAQPAIGRVLVETLMPVQAHLEARHHHRQFEHLEISQLRKHGRDA